MGNVKSGHPKGLYILFFAEMWERFSFYGMRALLVLYMTKHLFYGDARAYSVYGAYGALVYTFPVIGGMLADRFLGYRNAVVLGGILMALGHFAMAIPNETYFYLALGLLCLGNGFFKPNISSMVGKLYPEGDPRRDSGFTIFYMGVNLGAFFSPIVCGLIGEIWGWHYGFGLAGVGMLLGLGVFIKGQHLLEGHGLAPHPANLKAKMLPGVPNIYLLYFGCLLLVPGIAILLNQNQFVGSLIYIVGFVMIAYLLYVGFTSGTVARDRLFSLIILMFFHTAFWAFFEQAGSSLVLFADRNVDRMFFGWEMPASTTQSFNPLFIIFLAPFFARLWMKLQIKKSQPSIAFKFVLGMVQLGLGFGAFVMGAKLVGDNALVGMIWLVLGYFLHTTGELCLSPVGLSAVTKLAPSHVVGTVMGTWFLTTAFSHHFAGLISKLTAVPDAVGGASAAPSVSLALYSSVFQNICIVAIVVGVILWVLTPLIRRMMHGVE